jgi:hypothetical protein
MRLLPRKQKRPRLVAILGSGPAALFAAQAVYDAGHIVNIYARGERSPLYGAQYLHQPIPGLDCGRPETISYILKGTFDGYRRKVYGDGATIQVSPEALAPNHEAWDIRAAYAQAWERFSPLIRPTEITPIWLDTYARTQMVDLMIWALPLAPFCVGGHGFVTQSIWAQGDAPDLDRYCSVSVEPWTVVANGEDSPRWYRASNVFGHKTAEWPSGPKPPVDGIVRVDKPVVSNCSCWLEFGGTPVLRVGRYGTWTKNEFSHQAYVRTRAALESM